MPRKIHPMSVAIFLTGLPATRASHGPPLEQILGDFERLEREFMSDGFRGCPFVNAVAELGEPRHAANKIAVAFKERRRIWFRDLLAQLDVAHPDGLANQLMLLVDGAISAALVRGDPKMARAARDAARTLLTSAGVAVSAAPARGEQSHSESRRARRRNVHKKPR